MKLKGKRLLILGGTRLMVHVVNIAKELGVYTVVMDMDPKSPAKKNADKAYDISTREIDKVVEMALNEGINGVFVGYDDQNTGYAIEICEKLGLPFYATKEQIAITRNKILFKQMCRKFDIPVVQEYEIGYVKYPCVVKPADSYSAKGITICYSDNEQENAIQYAKQFSMTDQYLIEKYMDDTETDCVNIDYLLVDGEIILSLVGDKYVKKQGNKAPLTDSVIYPSKHMKQYIETVDSNMKRMFKSMNMKNGTVFIESFVDKTGFAIYEMGYRVGGGQSSILLNEMCGVDYIKLLIHFALTGKMTESKMVKFHSPKDKCACGMVVLVKPGTIDKIEGIEEIKKMPGVVNITQYLGVGDSVEDRFLGTLGQTFARIHIVEKDKQSLQMVMDKIKSVLCILDKDAHEMIIR